MKCVWLLIFVLNLGVALRVEEAGTPGAKPLVVFVCGLHGRELQASELCERWLREIHDESGCPLFEVVFLLDTNPQGALRALLGDPCYRGNGAGVDLNRNFPPISNASYGDREPDTRDEYPGPHPLSEPESQAIANELNRLRPDLLFAVHWGTNAVLAPYDGTYESPINLRDHFRLAHWLTRYPLSDPDSDAEVAISTGARGMYRSVGTLTDYAYDALGVPLVFTIEAALSSSLARKTNSCRQLFRERPVDWEVWYNQHWAHLIRRLCRIRDQDHAELLRMTKRA
jgi:hypothetical protein